MGTFHFKEFSVKQDNSTLKVGTDSMLLGAFVFRNKYCSVLDIGCGTGVLSLMVAQTNPSAKIHAIDVDEYTLEDCSYNFAYSPFKERLTFERVDIKCFPTSNRFDCIVCNPPYYENGLLSDNVAINNAKHVSGLQLTDLIDIAILLLENKGDFWMIMPALNSYRVKEYALLNGFYLRKEITIYSKIGVATRTLFCFTKDKSTVPQVVDFVIRNNDNSYTEQYKELTIDFHSKKL